jgi:hypothetical protein
MYEKAKILITVEDYLTAVEKALLLGFEAGEAGLDKEEMRELVVQSTNKGIEMYFEALHAQGTKVDSKWQEFSTFMENHVFNVKPES